jgi:hypothetical protein
VDDTAVHDTAVDDTAMDRPASDDLAVDRPRACNIGPAEIARRRRAGIAGLLTAATLAVLMLIAGTDPLLRWIVAVPLYVGLLGLVQARLRFCVAFGMAGVENFGALGGQRRVGDRGTASADRRRAIVIAVAVALVALAITALLVAIPT